MSGRIAESDIYTPDHARRFRLVVGPRVLGTEGGHSNNLLDRGGETNFGISLRFLKAEGRIDLDGDGFADYDLDFDGDIDGADIRLLTPEQSLDLGERCFWLRHGLWKLPQPLDAAVFDQAFNGGALAGVKLLQRALNEASGLTPALLVDGRLGPRTLARAWAADARGRTGRVLAAYRRHAAVRYRAIVAGSPKQKWALNGWLARAKVLGDV